MTLKITLQQYRYIQNQALLGLGFLILHKNRSCYTNRLIVQQLLLAFITIPVKYAIPGCCNQIQFDHLKNNQH